MDLTKLIDTKTLTEDCRMTSCKTITSEKTGEVVKIICEYVPKDVPLEDSHTPLFRSQK